MEPFQMTKESFDSRAAMKTSFPEPSGEDANGFATYGNDDGLPVEFFLRSVEIKHKSKPGEPFLEQREFIKISYLGTPDFICREVYPKDKRRWPRQYKIFKEHGTSKPFGTPLQKWGVITPVEVSLLQGQNVHTVENLAAMPDSALVNIRIPDIRGIQNKAKDFVAKNDSSLPFTAIKKENLALKEKLETQGNEIAEMKDMMKQFMAAQTPPAPVEPEPELVPDVVPTPEETAISKAIEKGLKNAKAENKRK